MDIVNPEIVNYLLNVTPERDEILKEMEEYAHARNFPIIGPLIGRLLCILAQSARANRILELGSGFGYSACWFARAIENDGKVYCTEGDPQNARRAEEYFHRAKISNKVDFRVGDGLHLMDQIEGELDIIFNDVDKHQYPEVFRKAIPRLRKGGLLISDNVLWSGKILGDHPDRDTAGILTYNRLIYTSDTVSSAIIPLRDGLSISIKH